MQIMLINHLKNILFAGITLHVKDNLPIGDRSCCFVHLWRDLKDYSKEAISCLQSLNVTESQKTVPNHT